MMVTMLIFIVPVFMALYCIFDMSVKVFMVGNNKAEAMEKPGWVWRRWSGRYDRPTLSIGAR